MGVLRDQMIRELRLRRYAPTTQRTCVAAVVGLTKHFGIAPDRLSARQVQDYLLFLMTERKLRWNTVNSICSGITFFYTQTVNRHVAAAMPLRRTPRQLPEILSGDELVKLTIGAGEFLRRFLLHVTPPGMCRIRHYGFLSNRNKEEKLPRCRALLGQPPPAKAAPLDVVALLLRCTGVDVKRCPHCQQGTMVAMERIFAAPPSPPTSAVPGAADSS